MYTIDKNMYWHDLREPVELSKSTWKFGLPNRLRSTFWLQNGFSCSYLNWVILECLDCFSSELVKHVIEVDDFLVGWFLYVYSNKLIVISEGAFCYIMTINMVASSKKTAMRENQQCHISSHTCPATTTSLHWVQHIVCMSFCALSEKIRY